MRFRSRQRKRTKESATATRVDGRNLGDEHGKTYQNYVERQLADERKRFDSLETKAGSLISNSATLVTLILAVGALATNETTFSLSPAFRLVAALGLILFVLAAVAGLLGIKTREYSVPTAEALDDIRKDKKLWTRAEPAARGVVMQFDINTIRTLRIVNNQKAWWVARGRLLQMLATATLTTAAAMALGGY